MTKGTSRWADDSMALLDSVRKAIEEGDGDFLRETVHLLAQGVMEAEVTEITGCPNRYRHNSAPSRARGQSREGRSGPEDPIIELGKLLASRM